MIFGGLQKFTLIDYPGKLAATIFLGGCNFRCPFCYNPELVVPEKMKTLTTTNLTQEEIIKFLQKRIGMLDGVVICGGEPTIENDLPEFINTIKQMGYAIKLDTNGSQPLVLQKLLATATVDYVAMDIKAPKEKYSELTGFKVDIKKIEESIAILKNSQIDYEFRTTVVPLLLDKDDIMGIAQWLRPAKKYFLQQFRTSKNLNPEFTTLIPYSINYLTEIKDAVAPFFDVCQIRS